MNKDCSIIRNKSLVNSIYLLRETVRLLSILERNSIHPLIVVEPNFVQDLERKLWSIPMGITTLVKDEQNHKPSPKLNLGMVIITKVVNVINLN